MYAGTAIFNPIYFPHDISSVAIFIGILFLYMKYFLKIFMESCFLLTYPSGNNEFANDPIFDPGE